MVVTSGFEPIAWPPNSRTSGAMPAIPAECSDARLDVDPGYPGYPDYEATTSKHASR